MKTYNYNVLSFLFLVMCLLMVGCGSIPDSRVEPKFAVAKLPTPVLYSGDFEQVFGGENGTSLKFDDYGEIDEVEFIALPGTVFTIEGVIDEGSSTIYMVKTEDYPYSTEKGYFVDSRFVVLTDVKPEPRLKVLPPKSLILGFLRKLEGVAYTWGGNYCRGIPELLHFYPPVGEIEPHLQQQWMLSGVDCSGLLYEATNGFSPRNTSSLVSFGSPVPVAGLTAPEIAAKLLPLDIIVWRGHMLIALGDGELIESNYAKGYVVIIPAVERLKRIMEDRTPVDDYETEVEGGKFVVRRWMP